MRTIKAVLLLGNKVDILSSRSSIVACIAGWFDDTIGFKLDFFNIGVGFAIDRDRDASTFAIVSFSLFRSPPNKAIDLCGEVSSTISPAFWQAVAIGGCMIVAIDFVVVSGDDGEVNIGCTEGLFKNSFPAVIIISSDFSMIDVRTLWLRNLVGGAVVVEGSAFVDMVVLEMLATDGDEYNDFRFLGDRRSWGGGIIALWSSDGSVWTFS